MIFVFTKMTSVQTQNDGWHGLKKKGMGMFLGLADVPLTRPLHSSAMSWQKVSHFFPGEVSPKSAMLSNPKNCSVGTPGPGVKRPRVSPLILSQEICQCFHPKAMATRSFPCGILCGILFPAAFWCDPH